MSYLPVYDLQNIYHLSPHWYICFRWYQIRFFLALRPWLRQDPFQINGLSGIKRSTSHQYLTHRYPNRMAVICKHRQMQLLEHKPTLTLSQCTLAGPVYTGMSLVDPVYTGTPLEKLSWNSSTLECHWRNLIESAPHWDATGETLTFAACTGTPLEGLWQTTHALTHIAKHAE